MSRFNAYLRNASSLVTQYDGKVPLAIFLKQYFATERKYGATDRKIISGLCYQYFRLGHLFADTMEIEKRLLLAEFLCKPLPSKLIEVLRPEWLPFFHLAAKEKVNRIGLQWNTHEHTPWVDLLETEIQPDAYAFSILKQPELFLRIRPGKKKLVDQQLSGKDWKKEWITENMLKLPNGIQLENVLEVNRDVIVQDAGSQQCGEIIKKILPVLPGTVWDTCAASGGKSIHLYDLYQGKFNLYVSDVRPSILHNLAERLKQAGITRYQSFIADLTRPLTGKQRELSADVALLDVPCTGSGTWARTPEQHFFFKPENLTAFTTRQLSICQSVMDHVKTGGYFIYITCSVFKAENQDVTEKVRKQHNLSLLHQQVIDGTQKGHDSMYLAIMQKN